MPSSREDLRKNYINFYTVYSQNIFPIEGVMKFTISCLLTLQMLHTKFGLVNQVILTHDGRRITTDDAGEKKNNDPRRIMTGGQFST